MPEPTLYEAGSVTCTAAESFTPTPRLRWHNAGTTPAYWRGDKPMPDQLKLQQQWRGSSGTVQWRDVETVQEGGE